MQKRGYIIRQGRHNSKRAITGFLFDGLEAASCACALNDTLSVIGCLVFRNDAKFCVSERMCSLRNRILWPIMCWTLTLFNIVSFSNPLSIVLIDFLFMFLFLFC